MPRPQHLSCPNTAEGIRRINQKQELYDENPQRYEEAERMQEEQRLEVENEMYQREREELNN